MQSEIDFADLFTQAARRVVPRAQTRRLGFLFDYRGPALRWRADPHDVAEALNRLFNAALDILEDGFVFFTAQVSPLPGGAGCGVNVAAAASGHFAGLSVWQQVLARLQLEGVERMGEEAVLEWRSAEGVCPMTGGRVQFVLDETEGSLFSLQLALAPSRAWLDADDTGLAAHGARAWLVGDAFGSARSLERRLQRLGWATRHFASVDEAVAELQRMPGAYSRPVLVIVHQHAEVAPQALRPLLAQLPSQAQLVLAAQPARAADAAGEPGVEVRAYPFSPAELREFTRRAAAAGDAVSGQTRPAPLAFEQRRRALVVDDNAVNQLVATGMLQMLGFEVDTACDGVEAIESCMRVAPDLVLMDLHMPGMDGLEATRRLRLLQREGAIPCFPILAATADTTSQEACTAAGMDGHLPKPLNLSGLESQLRRLMAG